MDVTICPQCKCIIEAKDYFDIFYLAFESVLPMIKHGCGYSGLPIKITEQEFKKLKTE